MKELHFSNLGDVITFERGLTYSKADEVPESAIGVLRSNNVDLYNHSLNLDEIKFLNPSFVVPANKKVRKDSILMCMSNGSKEHLGKVAIIDKDLDYAFGGFMGLLTPNKAKVYPKYLYYTLISPDFKKHIRGVSDGANINNLKYADLSSFSFALFPIQEQQRIVEILDAEFEKIDALKANAENNLQNAKDLFQAALKKELEPKDGWQYYSIREIASLITKGASPKWQGNKYVTSDGILFITSENVREGFLDVSSPKYVDTGFNIKQKRSILKKYDVLVNIVGASIGRAAIFDIDVDNANINQAVALVRLKDIVLPQYLCCYLNSSMAEQFYSSMKKDTARANLSLENISDIVFPCPKDIDNQRLIINRLLKEQLICNQIENHYNKTIALCDDLKQALLRKAFSGEL